MKTLYVAGGVVCITTIILFIGLYQQAFLWSAGPCLFAVQDSWMLHLSNVVFDITHKVCESQRLMGEKQLQWLRYQVLSSLSWIGSVIWLWYCQNTKTTPKLLH